MTTPPFNVQKPHLPSKKITRRVIDLEQVIEASQTKRIRLSSRAKDLLRKLLKTMKNGINSLSDIKSALQTLKSLSNEMDSSIFTGLLQDLMPQLQQALLKVLEQVIQNKLSQMQGGKMTENKMTNMISGIVDNAIPGGLPGLNPGNIIDQLKQNMHASLIQKGQFGGGQSEGEVKTERLGDIGLTDYYEQQVGKKIKKSDYRAQAVNPIAGGGISPLLYQNFNRPSSAPGEPEKSIESAAMDGLKLDTYSKERNYQIKEQSYWRLDRGLGDEITDPRPVKNTDRDTDANAPKILEKEREEISLLILEAVSKAILEQSLLALDEKNTSGNRLTETPSIQKI